jgi:hypothetical protein
MRIKRTLLRKIGLAVLIAVIAGALLVSFSLAASTGATILTQPIKLDQAVYYEVNGNGLNDPEEFVGIFDVYSGDEGITFSWPAFAFAQGVNGSYRVALLQNLNPLGGANWSEVAYAHHWANNPNGTMFTMGPFNLAYICGTCPSRFVVQPETYATFYDPTTQTYEYEYTPVAGAYGASGAALTQSDDFVIEVFFEYVPAKEPNPTDHNCTPTGTPSCGCVGIDYVCVDSCGNVTIDPEVCQIGSPNN